MLEESQNHKEQPVSNPYSICIGCLYQLNCDNGIPIKNIFLAICCTPYILLHTNKDQKDKTLRMKKKISKQFCLEMKCTFPNCLLKL